MPFYYAYCKTEKKALHTADSDRKVAENSKKNHENKNQDHDVEIREK